MRDTTKAALVRDFVCLAKKAGTESDLQECVKFVRDNILPANASRDVRKNETLNILNLVAAHFDDARHQTSETYDTIVARIPAAEENVRQAVNALALNEGIIKAPARQL